MSSSSQHHSSSPDALYHIVPQFPDPNVPPASDIELDGDENDSVFMSTENPIDARIRWIYFMFGAAVLLPWNGAIFTRGITKLSH
jgi:hypothetical protein